MKRAVSSQQSAVSKFVIILSIVLGGVAGMAQAEEVQKNRMEFKHVQGTISAINKFGVEVMLSRTATTSQDIYLPFLKGLRVGGAATVADLREGDTITVEYRELASPDEHGEYTRSKREASAILLVARAPVEAAAQPTVAQTPAVQTPQPK